MTDSFYLLVLISLTILVLVWGLKKRDRVYQYPFVIAFAYAIFIIPQALRIVQNPPLSLVTVEATDRILIYSCLCLVASFVGYQSFELADNPHPIIRKILIPLDEEKLLQSAFILGTVALLANYYLRNVIEIQTISGGYTGIASVLHFFASLSIVSSSIFFRLAIQKLTLFRLLGLVIFSHPLLFAVFEQGRRQRTMILVAIIALTLFYMYRWTVPRILAISSLLVAIILLSVLAQMRGDFWALILAGKFQAIDWSFAIERSLESNPSHELMNAIVYSEVASRTGQYGFGTGIWDAIVFGFVPGQFVGYDLKESLQFNWLVSSEFLENYTVATGSTITGLGDTFLEFSYLGCFLFFLQGRFFKFLWIVSTEYESLMAQLYYIALFSAIVVGITHGFHRFVNELVFYTIFLVGVFIYSSDKQHT